MDARDYDIGDNGAVIPRAPASGECDWCGGAHFTNDCDKASAATITKIEQHVPRATAWECESCNDVHQNWSCSCGWENDMNDGAEWHAHLIEVLTPIKTA